MPLFHFEPDETQKLWGPYLLPSLGVDVLCFEQRDGVLFRIAPVVRFQIR